MKRFLLIILVTALVFSTAACSKPTVDEPDILNDTETPVTDGNENVLSVQESDKYPNATKISLSDDGITVEGTPAPTDSTSPVYVAHDIVYYHDGEDFTYGEGDENDAHSAEEADAHTVVHIGKAGTYVISGTLSRGQIAVDLGDDAKDDPEAVVTLVLNSADITCTVAPAVIFYKVYESADADVPTKDVDTTAAGANVIIADGTVNTLNGSYVAKIYKSVTLSEDSTEIVDSKKLHKYDGALYSKMTMNICGEENGDGVLNVNAENEGIDSEMHLTVWGGNINIVSGDDGINTNEDGISVTTVNGGNIHITVDGKQGEGDGIDSNGWLVINGGTVIAEACSTSGDAGIDSDMGIHLNGGTVVASGNMYDKIDGGEQNYIVFTFRDKQSGGKTYTIKTADGEEALSAEPTNDFTYLVVSAPELTEGEYSLECDGEKLLVSTVSGRGFGGMRMPDGMNEPPEKPDGMGEPPEMPDGMVEPPEKPDGMNEPPEMPDENGEPPEKPDGMGEPPEKPDGMSEPPEMPDGMGEPPEMPEGIGEPPEMPDGMSEPPEMPEGMAEPPEMPDGEGNFGGFGGGHGEFQPDESDATEIFTVISGGNFFTVTG